LNAVSLIETAFELLAALAGGREAAVLAAVPVLGAASVLGAAPVLGAAAGGVVGLAALEHAAAASAMTTMIAGILGVRIAGFLLGIGLGDERSGRCMAYRSSNDTTPTPVAVSARGATGVAGGPQRETRLGVTSPDS
jgi:hypothetical protein